MTAVRALDYDPTLVTIVAAPGFDKRDMMERTWRELGAFQPQSLCFEDSKYCGAGNPYLHDPICDELLPGLDELVAVVGKTTKVLTIRRSWHSHEVCQNCTLDTTFATYFCTRLFPLLTTFVLHDIRMHSDTSLAIFLKRHSVTLEVFRVNKVAVVRGSRVPVFQALLEVRCLERLHLEHMKQHVFRDSKLWPAFGRRNGGLQHSKYPEKPTSVDITGTSKICTYLQASIDDFPRWLRDRNYCIPLSGCRYRNLPPHERACAEYRGRGDE